MSPAERLPSPHRSLSARLLVLTIAFVLLGEVLIYVPSISRFRKVFLEERLASAHLATLSLEAAGPRGVPPALEDELLQHVGVRSITLRGPAAAQAELMLGDPPPVDASFDLRDAAPLGLILDAFATLWHGGERTIRAIGRSARNPDVLIDIRLPERPMWHAMVDYSWRILNLSIVLSLLVAMLVYASLQGLIVRPLRRITESMVAFRRRPEEPGVDVAQTDRGDEIGVVQGELARMQQDLRRALAQRARLAALGAAVGKINHDLRNILARAILLSDRLEASQDPEVRHVAPRIVAALDRAARLCTETLNFARAQAASPKKARFALAPLADEVGEAVLGLEPARARWRNEIGRDVLVNADRDQLFRVLMNLGRNALQAMPEEGGLITVNAWREDAQVVIEVADTGRGIPAAAQAHLFEAFSGSTRPGGTGLGLAIAREIMRAHGGEIELAHTGDDGTAFRLALPAR